jgi:ribosomal protein S20
MTSVTRRRKLTLVAGAAAVALLVAGLGAAGAIAASRILSPGDESKAVIDDAAAQLGVKPQALSDALTQALENRIDAAVDAGRLTKDQADELKKRLAGDFPLLLGPGRLGERGFGHGFRLGPEGHFEILGAAASYLGLSEAKLREALEDNKTLAQIAKEQGKSASGLVQALVNAEEKRIDEAVADGRITKGQASELKAGLQDRVQALVDGELRDRGFGRHPGFWPGAASPRGPPAFLGAPA